MQRILSHVIYSMTTIVGIVAFLYPFWLPSLSATQSTANAHNNDATLILTVIIVLCFALVLLEVQSQAINTKSVALLGILIAMNATLRFVDSFLPIPGGFSPIFVLIILTGYVYGGRFGFLMGALTLLVSALLTGGLGPWLPYQMLTAGWIGMTAPLCQGMAKDLAQLCHRLTGQWWLAQIEVLLLAIFGGIWGVLFGAIINLWFWPFAVGDATLYWQPGVGLGETVRRYLFFYLTTSFLWDSLRMVGNLFLILLMGRPLLKALRRFHMRFDYHFQPLTAPSASVENAMGRAQ